MLNLIIAQIVSLLQMRGLLNAIICRQIDHLAEALNCSSLDGNDFHVDYNKGKNLP